MLYTVSKIKKVKACPFSGYLSTAGYHQESTKYLHILDLYKKALSENITVFGDFFDDNANDKFYTFEQEKSVDRNLFMRQLIRMSRYLYENSAKVIDSNVSRKITILDQEVLVKTDLVIQFPDRVELVKLSTSKPKLSYSARSDENKPQNNFELHLMSLLGDELYPDRETSSAFYSLNGKHDGNDSKDLENREFYNRWLSGDTDLYKDLAYLEDHRDYMLAEKGKREANKVETRRKKLNAIVEFDGDKGSHIIRQSEANVDYILNELQEVFDTELNMNSEKCVSNDCKDCQYNVICSAKQFVKVELEKVVEDKSGFGKKKKSSPTEAQQKLIDFEEGYARTNACPGSGKTFSITQRFAKLLETHSPSEILLITYTNAGAQEMKERVAKITDVKEKDMFVFTFNAFGMYIIENEYERLGFTKKPELLDKIYKIDMIKEMLNTNEFNNIEWLNYKHPMLNLPKARGAIYQVIDLFNDIEKSDESVAFDQESIKLYDSYKQLLLESNKLEYSDQLNMAIKLLSENEDLLEKYGFAHVMTDEYNDVNETQVEFLKVLEEYSGLKSMVAIGDDSQSVFSFNNTSPKFMIEFNKYFLEYKDINILDNFRSHKEICDICNKFIEYNESRVPKDMLSFKGVGGSVELVEYPTLSDEHMSIANTLKDSNSYQNVAVLARTSKELLELQKVLDKENIPSKLSVPKRHLNNHNILLMINLAKYLNSDDYETNDYYLFEYTMAICPEIIRLDELEIKVATLKDAICESEDFGIDKIEIFLELAYDLTRNDNDARVFIDGVYNFTQWFTFNDFASYLIKYSTYQSDSQSEKNSEKHNAVTLTTFHSSKGREFDKVFVLLDKLDRPKDMSIEEIEEQRRLLYVAMSRAERELVMLYNTKQDKKRGQGTYPEIIDEIKEVL